MGPVVVIIAPNLKRRPYKFYLSLENSICKDYMTEKLWNALNHSVVPIVLGGGDYANTLPEGSYIDASSNGPKALAALMKTLDEDESRYAEYFWWKERFSASVLSEEEHAERHCALCERLHRDDSHQVMEDLEKWWEKEGRCTQIRF
ncbi:FucTC CG40305PAlike [Caligus rogercresseyi]|uniref:Fucosyltransferase n=1 Tax=Caligus rogercresseyi TaxID=217165 RepID=A0A7T8HKJ7_CALRO|nr:FucTC CG40305PAlike [Caligus rogercresseyi]